MSGDGYQMFCVWVVTVCGGLVIVAFAVYFVCVIARLVRELLRSDATPAKPVVSNGCGCGGVLGAVEKVVTDDDGAWEHRTCLRCQRKIRVPYMPTDSAHGAR